jgi:hypothetical protein
MQIPFQPAYNSGVTVTSGATTDFTTFGPNTSESVVLTNLGTTTVFVRVGSSLNTVEASVADYPVVAGSQVSLGKTLDDNVVAYISPDGAGSLHIILGRGL